MPVSLKWLGHSAFSLDVDGHAVLIDPFLSGNPLAAASPDELEPELLLLSHAHGDHLGDTVAILKRTGATFVANHEIGNWMMGQSLPQEQVVQVNPGGTWDAGFMRVKWTIAHHSSSFPDGTYGGQPNGFIMKTPQMNLYFAGDTSLFLDMQLIGEEGIDVAFLPIGDHFTMGVEDSIKAINFVNPKFVLPMHYNTFPPIVQDVVEWAKRVNNETNATPIVLDPGGDYTFA